MLIMSCYYAFAGLETSKAEVYPKDKHFQVGSTATFCCVLPAGDVFDKMSLTEYSSADMNTTRISNQTYALTVHLNQASKYSCTDVKCELNPDVVYGACAYIGCKYDLVLCSILES